MEKTNYVKRSALYEEIYSIVKQIPMRQIETDAMDAPSASVLIEQLFKKLQQHSVSGKRPHDFLNWTRDNFCPIGGNKWVKENWEPSDKIYKSDELWELFMAACASGAVDKTT